MEDDNPWVIRTHEFHENCATTKSNDSTVLWSYQHHLKPKKFLIISCSQHPVIIYKLNWFARRNVWSLNWYALFFLISDRRSWSKSDVIVSWRCVLRQKIRTRLRMWSSHRYRGMSCYCLKNLIININQH